MYLAINQNVIVKVKNDTNLKNICLEAEVVATTKDTEKLQGKTIVAERRLFTELADAGEDVQTTSGIILGDRVSYASLAVKDIVAVKG